MAAVMAAAAPTVVAGSQVGILAANDLAVEPAVASAAEGWMAVLAAAAPLVAAESQVAEVAAAGSQVGSMARVET